MNLDVNSINRDGWDRRVEEQDAWTQPVSSEEIAHARMGDWYVILTPNKKVPRDWFGDVAEKEILCLASGGGQQGPILAAAGARVVVFDASPKQLAQDDAVAHRDGLQMETQLGFMHDLSVVGAGRFDLIFHPASNLYTPDVEVVWRECFRVLKPGGVLLSGFMNPFIYIFDADAQSRGELVVRHSLPYADNVDLSPGELQRVVERDHTVEFSHALETQIGGQLEAGFILTGLYEDTDRTNTKRSQHFPTCIATRALKL